MTASVIVAGARTPIGKFAGGFKDLAAVDLGAAAIREAVSRAGVSPEQIEYVLMGQVLQGVAGQITIAVAGGMESMTNAPYALPKARSGARMGNTELVDLMVYDGLWSTFTDQHMGDSSDEVNTELGIGREEQDEWAARSHQRAAEAWESGRFAEEVVPVEVPQRKGDPVVVERDEGIRGDTTAESLGKLKPAFKKDGTITAGNASQISDGAAAVVVMSQAKAEE